MITSFERKVLLNPNIEQIQNKIKDLQQPIVFTNGCFDILHRGHITYLEQAKSLGKSLIVGVNSDQSVKRLNKGDDRPINSLEDRMAILSALESVDLVISFDQDTPHDLILQSRPHILVKGGDWTVENIVGASEVKSWGGTVYSIPFEYQRSTTQIIQKIRL